MIEQTPIERLLEELQALKQIMYSAEFFEDAMPNDQNDVIWSLACVTVQAAAVAREQEALRREFAERDARINELEEDNRRLRAAYKASSKEGGEQDE